MRVGILVLCLASQALGCTGRQGASESPKPTRGDPHAVSAMLKAVQASSESEGRKRAVTLLEQAVKLDPDLWEAHFNLGILATEAGEYEKALHHLEKSHAAAPNAEDIVVALAHVHERMGNPKLAVTVLEPYVKRFPDAIAARTVLIASLRVSAKLNEARIHAREVLIRHPGDPQALAELALTHLAGGEADLAALIVQEALKAEPPSAVAERTAGLVALHQGDDALAFKHFERAGELDPDDILARLNMATVLLKAGVYEASAKHFSAVLQRYPKETSAMLGLAAALRGQGSRDKKEPYVRAEKLLLAILELEPTHVAAHHNLALLYANFLENKPGAKRHYQLFLKHAPKGHPGRSRAKELLALP